MPPARPGRDAFAIETIATTGVRWRQAWRIIASRYPPINLFERLTSDTAVWEALTEAEEATNPRLRQETGQISLVRPSRRVSGPGASYVMASFTHLNPKGSRFSDGTFGVYYAAARFETAVAETAYHFARFARDSHDPPRREDMRVLLGTIGASDPATGRIARVALHRLADLPDAVATSMFAPGSYAFSQSAARALRGGGSNGVVYPSVRDRAGQCIGAFWPDVVGIPVQERHLQYEWNGVAMTRYWDYATSEWVALPKTGQ